MVCAMVSFSIANHRGGQTMELIRELHDLFDFVFRFVWIELLLLFWNGLNDYRNFFLWSKI